MIPSTTLQICLDQCFRSGSGLDPVSIRSVDPDSEYGSRRAKMTHKNRKKLINRVSFFLSDGCSLLRVEGFSCSMDVL
jgi:hypothetical protein